MLSILHYSTDVHWLSGSFCNIWR